jgi:thioredoxin-related protein
MKRTAFLLFTLLTLTLTAAPEYPEMGPDIYDTKANGQEQISAALQKAGPGHKHVLVVFGANWCIWCHRLHETFATNEKIAAALRASYEVVLIDVNTRHGEHRNSEVDNRYGSPTKQGLPVLVVLDSKGNQLTTQDTGALEEGAMHSPRKVLGFLDLWKPKGDRSTSESDSSKK